MSQSNAPGLTPEDYRKLRDIARNGPWRYGKHSGGPSAEHDLSDAIPVVCRHCGYEWEYTGHRTWAECSVCRRKTPIHPDTPRRPSYDIDLPKCNAIRAAARDGQSYGEIARLFSFLSSPETARKHATGECQHGEGDMPTLGMDRGPGFGHEKVGAGTCRWLRERWADGEFETYTEAGEALHCSRHTVSRHINGECSHGGSG